MQFLILWTLTIFIVMACQKNESQDTQQVDLLSEQQLIRDIYCSKVNDATILKRCDRATFAHIPAAFCPQGDPLNVTRHEWYNDGQLYRDVNEKHCLDDLDGDGQPDSKSECSPDMFVTRSHYWISKGPSALPEARRVLSFLQENDWYCGDGDRMITNVRHLEPLIQSVIAHLESQQLLTTGASHFVPAARRLIFHLKDKGFLDESTGIGAHNCMGDFPNYCNRLQGACQPQTSQPLSLGLHFDPRR